MEIGKRIQIKDCELIGRTYSCPVSLVSFRSKKRNRQLTEEQRRKIGEQLHKNQK